MINQGKKNCQTHSKITFQKAWQGNMITKLMDNPIKQYFRAQNVLIWTFCES